MKVLMFGWEFPPHISGGLGTACYGLTKGLSKIPDLEVTLWFLKRLATNNRNRLVLLEQIKFLWFGKILRLKAL